MNESVEIENGETANIPLDLNASDGSAYNLTSKRVTFSVAVSLGGARLLIKDSDDSAKLSVTAPATLGLATVHIIPTDYTSIPPGIYRYSVWVDAAGVETHMATGILTVTKTVARA